VILSVEALSWTTSEPGSGVAEHALIAEVAASPGALLLERLQPTPPKAIGQGNHEPLLARGEPRDQPSQLPKLSLIHDRCLHVPVLLRWCMSAPNDSSLIVDRWTFHLDPGTRQLGRHQKMFTFCSAARLYDWDREGYAAGPGSAMVSDAVHRGGRMPYLVRHAHAGNKRAWAGPDSARPLSIAGRQEAHGLLTRLRDHPISRILSSPSVRCLETVEPLAQRRGHRVESADVLGVDADPTDLVALLLDPASARAVLCSHGELIGAALTRLVGERFKGDSLSWPKGSTWVLKVTEGRIEDARYLPPLRLQGSEAGYY
jgi:phosphohistidine phosphatase SixA